MQGGVPDERAVEQGKPGRIEGPKPSARIAQAGSTTATWIGSLMADVINLADLIATAGDAVIVSDAAGAIVVWNPAAERIFGFAEAEALGRTLDIITPERHRERHWSGYAKSMETGATRYGDGELLRVPALRKDGSQISIAFTVGMLLGADGRPVGVSAIVRDETSRFEGDRRTRKRLAELEAKVKELEARTGACAGNA